MHKILLTCPPMIASLDEFYEDLASAALDVLEQEPINLDRHRSLLEFSDRLILGSHTFEAVSDVSRLCIQKLHTYLSK